jgi:hypothetical protein
MGYRKDRTSTAESRLSAKDATRVERYPYLDCPSEFPVESQSFYCFNPRSHSKSIEATTDKMLARLGLSGKPLTRLPMEGNLRIPSTHPNAGNGEPLYWAARVSKLLPQSQMDRILDALESAERVSTVMWE